MQLSKKIQEELYKEAQTNGFNSQEYLLLLTGVDNLLNEMSLHTQEAIKGTKPNDYDVDGRVLNE